MTESKQSVLLILECSQHGHYGEGPRPQEFYYFEPGTFPYTENCEQNLYSDYVKLNKQARYFLETIGGVPVSTEKAISCKPDKIYKFKMRIYEYDYEDCPGQDTRLEMYGFLEGI